MWPVEGLDKREVVLREHDPAWLESGAAISARLREVLGELAIAVEHIGSTAVPGMLAKPIVDLAVGVETREHARSSGLRRTLTGDGWIHVGERPELDGGVVFVAESAPLHRYAHVHVVRYDGVAWRRYLAFRDALRADPALRDGYAQVKLRLAAAHPADREAYTTGKTAFVTGVPFSS